MVELKECLKKMVSANIDYIWSNLFKKLHQDRNNETWAKCKIAWLYFFSTLSRSDVIVNLCLNSILWNLPRTSISNLYFLGGIDNYKTHFVINLETLFQNLFQSMRIITSSKNWGSVGIVFLFFFFLTILRF